MPIAVSHLRDKQEALLLMKPLDWVRSSLGTWQLKAADDSNHAASLRLLEQRTLK
jgi:hypothetical protein